MKIGDIAIVLLIAVAAGFLAWTYRDNTARLEAQKANAAAKLAYDELSAADKKAFDQIAARAQAYLDKLNANSPVVALPNNIAKDQANINQG